MCGIAGILNVAGGKSAVTRQELVPMVQALHHRGPDGTGYYLDESVGLGHARLSIIDLETGDQPITNEDQSVWVVFNGEIFNYLELRRELIGRGHRFSTRSDTEVIVHLYEERGLDFVDALNGQFAIALWDTRRNRLVLTRDRPGILPLYYSEQDGRLIFASEIKSILRSMRESPSMNLDALDQVMTFWAPVSPNTMFEGVFEVEPGTQLVVECGEIRRRRYWSWEFPEQGDYTGGSEAELTRQARDLLEDATRIRLRADVPVGAYLSGGLDSSALTALIQRDEGVRLRTFSIEFDDPSLDEGSWQRVMANYLGTDHSSVRCGQGDIASHFPKVIWHTESTILRSAPVPMHMLSGLVHEAGFKVVLTGEGADEVFGGYDLFKEAKIRDFWAKQPDSTTRPLLLKRLYPYLDLSKSQDRVYLQKFFGVGLERPEQPLFSHLTRAANTAHCKLFYSDGLSERLRSTAERALEAMLPESFGSIGYFNRAQFLEARTLMSGYLLSAQGDRMLMSHSVEGRFPFLDHRVIEFANRLDPRLKMKVLNEKHLLKQAVRDYLPASVLRRFKQPYRAPDIEAFFGQGGHHYVRCLLDPVAVQDAGYFNGTKVARLVKKIESGRAISNRDNMALVGILSTQVWHQLFVKGQSPADLVSV